MKLPLLLDGATGSNLIKAGMPKGCCVEQWVLEHPDVMVSLQGEYEKAGSDVVYAPTFGANSAALKHYGLSDKVAELNKDLVKLSKSAVSDKVMVAGDLSPTGLFIAPFGDAQFEEIVEIYTEQVKALYEAGADLIVCETLSNLSDIRAAVIAAKTVDLPIFVTITVDENGRTMSGTTPLCALIMLQEMGVAAFGLNCSNGPENMAVEIEKLKKYAKIPLIAKPNASLPGSELSPEAFCEGCKKLVDAGASIIGGCCGTTPEHIALLRGMLDNYGDIKPCEAEEVLAATSERDVYFLDRDNLKLSEEIECGFSLEDDLIDIEDDGINVAQVRINTLSDVEIFAESVHMARLPIAITTDSADVLQAALRSYQGRAIVNTNVEMDENILCEIASKYGAIIY
ncbi:MAG: homocysteine S-methyltransferase family protein [Clostridia bacterium]|nr:homocysteine S-methyltransferase family protein [Clostridia bacterium]